mgnify:CR=1 FL=1
MYLGSQDNSLTLGHMVVIPPLLESEKMKEKKLANLDLTKIMK